MIITPEEGFDVGIYGWHWDWSSHHEDIISEEENDNSGNHQINILFHMILIFLSLLISKYHSYRIYFSLQKVEILF